MFEQKPGKQDLHRMFSITKSFTSIAIGLLADEGKLKLSDHIADYFPDRGYTTYHGLFLILFAMFSAWLTDTFAYFTGSFLGKHKMCPNISPKKTYEGAIGGVIGCVISNVALYAVFENFVFENPVNNYLAVVLMSVALSVISMCGDLTASVVKRNFGIKDFGKLIPGHGGIMDRFDSVLFVAPVFWLYAVVTDLVAQYGWNWTVFMS